MNADIYLVNSAGARRKLNEFLSFGDVRFYLIYDSHIPVLRMFQDKLFNKSHYILFVHSWRLDAVKLLKIKSEIQDYSAGCGEDISSNLILLVNSHHEFILARSIIGESAQVHHVNQNWLLDPDTFQPDPTIAKAYDLVINSRAVAWKRISLSSRVAEKIFITYYGPAGMSPDDLEALRPRKIYTKLSAREVAAVLQQARVGAICSEIEGACYASTEYLLAGLPVVSTPSLGGRDEYYDSYNSIICIPTPEDLNRSVMAMVERLNSGEIKPAEVRRRAMVKSFEYRSKLTLVLSEVLAKHNLRAPLCAQINQLFTLSRDDKLYSFTNAQFVGHADS